jgi:ubiquinone/menaquinone biosynthesis C-methylase UbiE
MINKQNDTSLKYNDYFSRQENYNFYPEVEVVRFFSQYLRRRVELEEVIDVLPDAKGIRVIDIGYGSGHNFMFGYEMGLDMYGIKYSSKDVSAMQKRLGESICLTINERVTANDIRDLPWDNGFFSHAISDRTLDSMPFEIAQAGVSEIARVVAAGGYFYCNLISGDETDRDPNFCGDVVVQKDHNKSMTCSYYNRTKVRRLIEPLFEILSCQLHQVMDPVAGTRNGRWHIVSRRR